MGERHTVHCATADRWRATRPTENARPKVYSCCSSAQNQGHRPRRTTTGDLRQVHQGQPPGVGGALKACPLFFAAPIFVWPAVRMTGRAKNLASVQLLLQECGG